VAITSLARFDNACTEIVQLASRIIATDKVDDPNEIAFLFRSLKHHSQEVERGRSSQELAACPWRRFTPIAHN
jgi:hypothetical protein